MALAISITANALSVTDSTNYTFSSQSIGAAAADRDVVVGVHWTAGAAITLTSATIAGINATIDVQQPTDGAGNASGAAIIRARVPTGTTAQIIFFLSGTSGRSAIDVYRVTGAKTTLADTGSAGAQASPQSFSLNRVPEGGAIAVATVNDLGGAGTFTWTNLTEDTDRTVEDANAAASSAHAEYTTESGLVSVQAAASGGADNGLSMAGVSFTPNIEAAVGSAAGTSTATATAVALSFAAGSASGVATVSGVGEAVIAAVASASGTSTVSGVGFGGLRPVTGVAAGSAVVSGVSEYKPIVNTIMLQKPVDYWLAGDVPVRPSRVSPELARKIFRE